MYWDGNSSSFEAALKNAMDDMPTEGVYVQNRFPDQVLIFGEQKQFDISNVFRDLNDNPVTVTVESNSASSVATVTIDGDFMTVIAGNSSEGTAVVIIKGTSGEFYSTDEFVVTVYDPVNYTVEDFETADFKKLNWEFSGNAGWDIDDQVYYEGSLSAKSAMISHSQKAEMYLDAEFGTAGKIKFAAKTSSEANYDYLRFYIGRYEKKKMSGNSDWIYSEFAVEPGIYTFKWSYQKDAATSSFSDCAWVDFITLEGGRMTGIEYAVVPSETQLYQNYPNPFNPSTKISFGTDVSSEIRLSVFNHKGELVRVIFEGTLTEGFHSYDFNAGSLTSGIYFYKLETKNNIQMKKMLLLK